MESLDIFLLNEEQFDERFEGESFNLREHYQNTGKFGRPLPKKFHFRFEFGWFKHLDLEQKNQEQQNENLKIKKSKFLMLSGELQHQNRRV